MTILSSFHQAVHDGWETNSQELAEPGCRGMLDHGMRAATRGIPRTTLTRYAVAGGAFVVALMATGIPTDLLPNPLFRRMTPPTWWDRPVWLVSSVLLGLVAATYVRVQDAGEAKRRAVGGGLLSYLAVGCPACNKLVVLLLGLGGALQYFQPIQPLLATAGLALLVATLLLRTGKRAEATCRQRATRAP